MEQTRVQFATLLQSNEQGNALVDRLNAFANVTPFENAHLFRAARELLSFGIAGERVLPVLRMLGDVSGGNTERLSQLTRAYGKMHNMGRLTGETLEQTITAGFNPLSLLAKQSGKSMAFLREQMSKGAISADAVTDAFRAATDSGGRFHRLMERTSQTTLGRFSTLMGKVKAQLTELSTQYLLPITNQVLEALMRLVDGGAIQRLAGFLRGTVAAFQALWHAASFLFWVLAPFIPLLQAPRHRTM